MTTKHTQQNASHNSFAELRRQIINHQLEYVSFEGWRDRHLFAAARQLNMSVEKTQALFPRGSLDAAIFFLQDFDRQLYIQHNNLNVSLQKTSIREKISTLIMHKLELMTPHKQAVLQAIRKLSVPPYVSQLIYVTGHTAHTIWSLSNDQSSGYQYVSKRVSLSAVYMPTLVFWLQDESPHNELSKQFLQRRINNLFSLMKARTYVTKLPKLQSSKLLGLSALCGKLRQVSR